jgi:hypothetical protein
MVQSFQFLPITTVIHGEVVSDELICQTGIFRRHEEVASSSRETRWTQHYTILQRGRIHSQEFDINSIPLSVITISKCGIFLPKSIITAAEEIINFLIFISRNIYADQLHTGFS